MDKMVSRTSPNRGQLGQFLTTPWNPHWDRTRTSHQAIELSSQIISLSDHRDVSGQQIDINRKMALAACCVPCEPKLETECSIC